jgi:hypothetical protein
MCFDQAATDNHKVSAKSKPIRFGQKELITKEQ